MEELYKMMSSQEHERKKIRSAVLAVAALLVVSTAATWGMSHYRWSGTKSEARKLMAASRHEDALKIVDSFGKSYVFPDPTLSFPRPCGGERTRKPSGAAFLKPTNRRSSTAFCR